MIRFIGVSLTLPALLCLGTRGTAQETPLPAISEYAVNLEADDCALFVWVGFPSRLLFISQAEERLAHSAQFGGKRYAISPNRAPDKFGQYPNQDFLDDAGKPWQLRMDDPRETPGMVFYKSGTMTLPAPDGWLRIESAQAVSACNKSGFGSVLNLDQNSGGFTPPPWVETPARLLETAPPEVLAETSVAASEVSPAYVPDTIPARSANIVPQVIETPRQPPAPVVMAETTTAPDVETAPPVWIEANVIRVVPTAAPPAAPVIEPSPSPIIAPEPILEAITDIQPHPAAPVYMVQVGSYRTRPLARKAWIDLKKQTAYLREKRPVIQPAKVKGKGRYFRLRVKGFSTRTDAVEFCWRLQSDGLDCYVPSAR